MKRIKKMAGGALTDSSGNTVRSSDGEEVSYGEPRSNSRPDIDESIWDLREKASTGYGGMGSRRTEHEGPLLEPRVGQGECLVFTHEVVPEEEVEVDDARSVSLGSDAAKRCFDLEKPA